MTFDSGYRAAHSVSGDLLGAWGSFWINGFMTIGIVTVVFAVLERVWAKSGFLEKWDPAKLPPVRDAKQIPRYQSIIGIAANLIFLTWWVNGNWTLAIFQHSGVQIVFSPVWKSIYWGILLLSAATIVLFAVNFLRPQWTPQRATIQLILHCAGAAVFCWFLKARVLAEITVPNLSAARAAHIVEAINTNMARSFPFAVVACALMIVLADGGRLVRLRASRGVLAQSVS
jgi:hypothetical protein